MRFTLTMSIVALAVLTAAVPQPNAGVAIPITKHSGLTNADEIVDFEALQSRAALTEAKILRGLNNFEKNTGTPHAAAWKRTQRRGTGANALTNYKSLFWYGSISIGTPAKTFTVGFDTGSSDLFLPGPDCTSNCAGHTIYNPSASSTSQDLGKTFSMSYGGGSSISTVSGKQFSDTISVSGLTASKQTLGVAAAYSPRLAANQYPADGLMGMAFQSISDFNASPVFQSFVSQRQVDKSVFSFKLATSGSELYLGGVNSALYTGSFTYTPVTKQGFWQVSMDGVVGNEKTILSNIDSIIDTCNTYIYGNPAQVATLHKALGGTELREGIYTFPCSSFPSISFTFGGTSFAISADTLNVGRVSRDSSDCVSGIIGKDMGYSHWVIGDVFLRNVYTTFDVGNPRVGFAKLA